LALNGPFAKQRLPSLNLDRNASTASIDEMPSRRSSLTSRSCRVPLAQSTRSLACGELAQMMSMLSWDRQSEACPPDNKLPENSQGNLDARLDHAIEETFPTSDPTSVTVTKGAGTNPPVPAPNSQTGQDTAEHVLDQVREALNGVTEAASRSAEGVTVEASITRSKQASDTPTLSDMSVRANGS